MSLHAIPAELRDYPHWVAWRAESRRDGTPTKVPYRAADLTRRAATDDPETWATFEDAVDAPKRPRVDGIGYVFATSDPYTGIDLDHATITPGELHPAAAEVIQSLSSYAEWSPSGTGIHVIVKGSLPGDRHRTTAPWGGLIEVYDTRRFFTMTGDRLDGAPEAIESRQEALDRLCAWRLPSAPTAPSRVPRAPVAVSDSELLDRMFSASNGCAIRALWNGDTTGHEGDDSAADLALCSHLAYWTGGHPERVDVLFRASGLMREKWDEKRGDTTYGAMTIARAFSGGVPSARPPRGGGTLAPPPENPVTTGDLGGATPVAPMAPLAPLARLRAEAFSAVCAQRARWLWEGRIPLGAVTLLVGREKLGKSTLTCELAAQLSRGTLDGELFGTPAAALLVSFEDSAARTVKPRLMAAGADVNLVHRVLASRDGADDLLALPADSEQLAVLARDTGARLLVVDPFSASLTSDVDGHRDQHVRRALAPLSAMAEREDLAVVLVAHWNKGQGGDPLSRVLGSRGLTAAVRSVLAFGVDPDSEDGSPDRVLAHAACNLAREARSLGCRIDSAIVHDDDQVIDTSRLVLCGEIDTSAGDLLRERRAAGEGEATALDEAKDFLCRELAEGPLAAEEVRTLAKRLGITLATLRRAKTDLGVKSVKSGPRDPWKWILFQGAHPPMSTLEIGGDEHLGRSPVDTGDSAGPRSQGAHTPECEHLGDLSTLEIAGVELATPEQEALFERLRSEHEDPS